MRVALDAMGGDCAPDPIVAGALRAVADDAELRVTLVGDQSRLAGCLPGGEPPDRVELFHASQVIEMGESPVDALRKKPDNSISRCWQLLAEGKVEAVVSAGNTGAMVAGGLRLKKFLPNVRRPGIVTVMPTERGPCTILDVGANIEPKPGHLYQYGVMGSIFARYILGKDRPTIGLLNVGEEASKGHELAREAHALFHSGPLKDSFVGNIEGRDIHRGVCDVVISDGFVGNVTLKLCEGVFEFIMKMVAHEVLPAAGDAKMAVKLALENLVQRYHYSEFGGAPLLGIDGICIICHGSSDDRAIRNALNVAAKHARAGLNQKIVQGLAEVAPVVASAE